MISIISYIDAQRSIIPDKIIFPAFGLLLLLKLVDGSLDMHSLYAVALVLLVFILPIALNMNFGGGDLRFGAFCALFVGLAGIGWFVLLSGVLHLLLLLALKKEAYGFAPAMSVAALLSYGIIHL